MLMEFVPLWLLSLSAWWSPALPQQDLARRMDCNLLFLQLKKDGFAGMSDAGLASGERWGCFKRPKPDRPRPDRQIQPVHFERARSTITPASAPAVAGQPVVQTGRDDYGDEIVVSGSRVALCNEPSVGWLAVLDNDDAEPKRRLVQFAGGAPARRSGEANTVPKNDELLTFTASAPTMIYATGVPCFLKNAQRCDQKRMSGTFRVVGRARFPAGPRGDVRWQLCLFPVGGRTI